MTKAMITSQSRILLSWVSYPSKNKHLNGCFSFSLANPKLELNSVLASVYMVLNGSLLVRLKKEKYLGLKSLGGLAYVRTTHYSFLFPSSFLTLDLVR